MPGIVTSSGDVGSVKTYRVQFTSTSTSLAINWVSGTTASQISAASDKGVYAVFQNQSSAINITIGGPAVTATQGIILGPLSTSATNTPSSYVVFTAGSFSGIQMSDWYVFATSSAGAATAQLLKGV